ncbi:TPA: hypothetical protein OMS84_003886 [Enterobacter hormaechei]|nr:hypothetical protein [Enterobacter hormaechei]
MRNKDDKITKKEVSINFFLFMVVFLLFLSFIPKFYNFNYISTGMVLGKIIMGFLLIFAVSYNGANFVFKLLSYLEREKENKNNS